MSPETYVTGLHVSSLTVMFLSSASMLVFVTAYVYVTGMPATTLGSLALFTIWTLGM